MLAVHRTAGSTKSFNALPQMSGILAWLDANGGKRAKGSLRAAADVHALSGDSNAGRVAAAGVLKADRRACRSRIRWSFRVVSGLLMTQATTKLAVRRWGICGRLDKLHAQISQSLPVEPGHQARGQSDGDGVGPACEG